MTALEPLDHLTRGGIHAGTGNVWEHAFLLDYQPAERQKYIAAFFSNVDWSAVERRLLNA